MNLTELNKIPLKNKKRKRVGRGAGSGTGKTSGRGHKGQKSRSGFSMKRPYEGGQMPLMRRLPKRGFNNKWKQGFLLVNLSVLEKHFQDGDQVNLQTLVERKILNLKKGNPLPLKILGQGDLTKKLIVSAQGFSQRAMEQIQKAGGEVKKLTVRKQATREKMKRAKVESLQRRRAKKEESKKEE